MSLATVSLKKRLELDDEYLIEALLFLYDRQTVTEQRYAMASNKNSVGFNAFDAEILTTFAEFYRKRGFLSPKQKSITRRKLTKYHKQLKEM